MVYWCNAYLRDVFLLYAYQVKMHSGLIWRHHTDQLHAASDNINSNCDYTETLSDVVILSGNQNSPVLNSMLLVYSIFAARYPVRQHRAPDHYGISSSIRMN